jgi:aerobic carbon-monoxide dehydrogenase medium subunit
VTAMTALGARLVLADGDGLREAELPGFMTGPLSTTIGAGEVLRGVRIPKLSSHARWGYYKLSRKTGEFAHAIGAVVVDPATRTRRAVVGAVADAPALFVGEEIEPLLAAGGDRSIEAAMRLVTARRIGRDDISRQVFAVALARAAAMARTMQ